LADHNVWWDEGFSVYLARLPLLPMAVRTAADVHPPLHYALLHYWDRLVGESEYAIRYSTVLLGVLDLALLFWLTRRYLGPVVALGAVVLLAINRLHVEWSQEMRMYTLATALVLLSTACFLRLTHERDTRLRWWLGHMGLSVAGLYTIYVFGLAPICQTLAVLAGAVVPIGGSRRPPGFVARWLATQAAALALFAPWVLLFLAQPRPKPVLLYPIDLLTWLRAVYTALPIGISAYLENWTPVTVVATALFLLPLARARERPWVLLAGYLPLALSPLLLYGLSYPNPVLYAPNLSVRYVLLFLPLYCALAALGLVAVARRDRRVASALSLAAVAVCLWTVGDLYGSRWARDEYRTIASFIRSYADPGDAVVLYSDWDWPVAEYYLGTSLRRYGVGTLVKQTPESAAGLVGEWLGRHEGLWLVTVNDAYDADPEGHVRRELEGRAPVAADFRVANKRLTLFTTDPERSTARPVPTEPRRAAALSGQPTMIGFDRPQWEAAAGERIRLATYWRGPGPADARYRLELVGPDGVVRRRAADRLRSDWPAAAWPAAATARVEHEVRLDPRLPAGWYGLRIATTGAGAAGPVGLGWLLVRPSAEPAAAMAEPPTLPARDELFGGQVALIGAAVPVEAPRPGGRLTVRLLWRAAGAPERGYTGFAQLVGSATNPATGNPVWGQVDRPPDPARPTDDWLPGDWALDERTLTLPADTPPGEYRLIVGLYEADSGARLRLSGGGDHAALAVWRVAG
jgi:4-amino-4-deoxy-L-arabinose transferase-like glycosyltransferase